jgi:hypothetical protein
MGFVAGHLDGRAGTARLVPRRRLDTPNLVNSISIYRHADHSDVTKACHAMLEENDL